MQSAVAASEPNKGILPLLTYIFLFIISSNQPICQSENHQGILFFVGLQYILDSDKKKDEGFAQIGYCEFRKNNKDRKEVQIPHDNCNTGHEVQAIPNVLREEIWRSTSVAEI